MSAKEQVKEFFNHIGNHGALPGDHEALAAARAARAQETDEHQTIKTEAMGAVAVDGVLHPHEARELQDNVRHITVRDLSHEAVEIPVHQG